MVPDRLHAIQFEVAIRLAGWTQAPSEQALAFHWQKQFGQRPQVASWPFSMSRAQCPMTSGTEASVMRTHRRNYSSIFAEIEREPALMRDKGFQLRLIGRGELAVPKGLAGKVVKEADLAYPVSIVVAA